MNREIKFRGFGKEKNKWVYGYYVVMAERHIIYSRSEIQSFEVVPESVGQFTGLTDKKGVEIYEGDVLRTRYDAMFSWNNLVDYHLWDIHNSNAFSEVEIIGNIFQNPELLKQ